MKITRMKLKQNDSKTLYNLSYKLETLLSKKGFITHVGLEEGTIGLHMRSFKIDTKKLGYNAKISYMTSNPKKGYKRTDVPLWEQREEFNHIVNAFFDKHNITAKIVSGKYLVRDHVSGAVTEWECVNYAGQYMEPNTEQNGMGMIFSRSMTEKEAIEELS